MLQERAKLPTGSQYGLYHACALQRKKLAEPDGQSYPSSDDQHMLRHPRGWALQQAPATWARIMPMTTVNLLFQLSDEGHCGPDRTAAAATASHDPTPPTLPRTGPRTFCDK